MTLIIGLKSASAVVIAAETEETLGAQRRCVYKLARLSGADWCVVVGGAGDGIIAENAMRKIARRLAPEAVLTEEKLEEVIEDVVGDVHNKFIDPDPKSEGLQLVLGAICNDGLRLMSTSGRQVQFQDEPPYAYASYDSELGIYFLERANWKHWDWQNCAMLAASVVAEVKGSIPFCGGLSQIYVLQAPPAPRWRHFSGLFLQMLEFNELPRIDETIRSYMNSLGKNKTVKIEDWGREMGGFEQEGDEE